MNRAQKAEVIESIRQKADGASIAVITDFKGVTVEEMTSLRAKLREAGVEYQVVKNTLARLAVAGGQHEVIKDEFKENCAVAFGSEDPVACAKVLIEFQKSSKTFEVKLGSLEGSIIDADGIKALSKLPSKPELLGSALGTMNAVPTNFVCLFANLIRGLLNCLNGVKDQKEAA